MFGGLPGGNDIIAFLGVGNLAQFKSQLSGADSAVDKTARNMDRVLNVAIMAGAAAFIAAAAAAAQFESSFAGVIKTTDGLITPMGELTALGEELAQGFRNLALEIPVSVNELNRIGELGGQLGIGAEALVSFTETIANLGVTTDLSIEEAAMSMARFVNVTKGVAPEGMTAAEQIERMGSTIVALGNDMAANEPEISSFASRIAGAGNQIGLSQAEIMAFGATLASVGINAEAGGSAISQVFIGIASSVASGGDELELFAQLADKSIPEFSKLFKEDASEAIKLFIQGLGKVDEQGGNTFKVIEDLGFSNRRTRDALLKTSAAGDLLTKSLDLATEAYKENNALTREAEIRYGTFNSQLKLLGNAVNEAFIQIGDDLLPTLKSMVKVLTEHPEAVVNVIKTIGTLAIGLGVLAGAYKAVKIAQSAITATNALMATSFGPLGIAMGIAAAATAGINAIYAENRKNKLDEIDAITQNVLSVRDLAGRYDELREQGKSTALIEMALAKAFEGTGIEIEKYKTNMQGAADVFDAIKIQGLIEKEEEHATVVEDLNKKLWNKSGVLGYLTHIVATPYIMATKSGQKAVGDHRAEIEKINKDLEILTGKTSKQIKETKKLTQAEKDAIKEKGRLVKIAEARKKAMDEINTAGVTLTDSLELQIERYKELLPYIENDAAATLDLKQKIWDLQKTMQSRGALVGMIADLRSTSNVAANLSDSMEDSENSIENFRLGYQSFHMEMATGEEIVTGYKDKQALLAAINYEGESAVEAHIRALEASIVVFGLTGEEADAVRAEIRDLRDGTEEGGDEWIDYAILLENTIGKFTNLSPAVQGAISIFGQLMTSVDPLTIGINIFGMALDLLGGSNERVVLTVEDTIESLGILGEEIIRVDDLVESLSGTFDSQLLASLQATSDKILETKTNMANFGGGPIGGVLGAVTGQVTLLAMVLAGELPAGFATLDEALESITEEMGRFTEAFRIDIDFTAAMDSASGLSDEVARMIDLFGVGLTGSPGINQLLYEQVVELELLRVTLDPTSEAYRRINEKIQELLDLLAILNGDGPQGLSATDKLLEDGIPWWQDTATAVDEVTKAIGDNREAHGFLQTNLGQTNEGVRYSTELFDYNTTAVGAAGSSMDGFSKSLVDASAEIRSMEDDVDDLTNDLLDLSGITVDIFRGIEEDEFGDEPVDEPDFIPQIETLEKINIEVNRTRDIVQGLTLDWEALNKTMFRDYEKFELDLRAIADGLEQIDYFALDIAETDVDEQIGRNILAMQEYLATLNPESQAYQDAMAGLDALIARYLEMGGTLDPDLLAIVPPDEPPVEPPIEPPIPQEVPPIIIKYMIEGEIFNNLEILEIAAYEVADVPVMVYEIDPFIFEEINNLEEQAKSIADEPIEITYEIRTIGEPPTTEYHSGGQVFAHSGAPFSDEVSAILKENEFVLRPAVTQSQGAGRLAAFNATGDPNTLKGGDSGSNINVEIHEATPQTWVDIYDDHINPRSKDLSNFTVNRSRFKE